MISSKVLKMGLQKSLYQETCKILAGLHEFTVDFKEYNRQLDWLRATLIYDKTDKHLAFYDSYNIECTNNMIKSVELANISES